MWISRAVTPISVAFGVSLDDYATAGATPSVATPIAHTPTTNIRALPNIRVSPLPALAARAAYCIHTVRRSSITAGPRPGPSAMIQLVIGA